MEAWGGKGSHHRDGGTGSSSLGKSLLAQGLSFIIRKNCEFIAHISMCMELEEVFLISKKQGLS